MLREVTIDPENRKAQLVPLAESLERHVEPLHELRRDNPNLCEVR